MAEQNGPSGPRWSTSFAVRLGPAAPAAPAASAARIAEWLAQAQGHHQAGRLAEAEPLYRRILAVDPRHAASLHLLGLLAHQVGRHDVAVHFIGQAIAVDDRWPGFHTNLGLVLMTLGQLDEAAASHQRAIDLDPASAESHNNLAITLQALNRLEEAAAACRRAIGLKPGFAQAYGNLGAALQDMGRLEEAAAAYQRAVELQPDLAGARSNRLLCLHYSCDLTPEAMLAEHRRWDEAHGGPGRLSASAFPQPRDPERRLRIGYVSGDLRTHPGGYFLAQVLAAHDRATVETVCYANNPGDDEMTGRLRASADHWRNVLGVSDDDAAALIRRDGVDILIDLSGHTAHNRLLLFTRRPAPVQASWIGYPGTTGLSAMDYLLMDAAAVPHGAERWCSEAVARLAHGRFCYAPPAYAPDVIDPAARRGQPVTFGCFNNIAKIGPQVVRLWASVLEAAPGSRLLLKWTSLADPGPRRRLAEAFAEAGVAPGRLELRGPSPHERMLAEYGDVDIALDPFPFCGGLTSCEALWMGAPVVTLPGQQPASRQTLGFLEQLGLGDLAARTPADYVRIAAALAADPDRRAHLRQGLRPRMAASPLCDGAQFTPALEAAFRQMWRRWCAGQPAETFDAPAA